MLQKLKALLRIMQADPAVSDELPVLRSLALRTFGWMLATEFVLVAQFYPIKVLFDEISKPSPDPTTVYIIPVMSLVLFVAGQKLREQTEIARAASTWRMWRTWWFYGHLAELRLSTDWHNSHGTGEKESVVGKNIYRFEVMVDIFLYDTLPAMMRIMFTTILLVFLGWQFALLSLATCVLFGLILRNSERKLMPLRKVQQKELRKLERLGTELTMNWQTIKALGLEEKMGAMNGRELMDFVKRHRHRYTLYNRHESRQINMLNISRAGLLALTGFMALGGVISIGSLTLAYTWLERAYGHFFRFSDLQRSMNEGYQAMDELVGLMSLPPTIQQPDRPKWPVTVQGRVEFDNLCFTYSDNTKSETLCQINLSFEPHTTIGLMGPSGAGKSTLMSMLMREHDPTKGRIVIDGVDLRQIDFNRYRREMISVVPQKIQLFDGSIAYNIGVGIDNPTHEKVVAAAKAAHAHEFIMQLEDGYNTRIGEDGVRLSGGQRQRVAIARALIREPSILILDEATSALDAESQARIQETLNELIAKRRMTIFIIAHRLSTIADADTVVVMDDGRVVQHGTHKQLAEQKGGLYTKLRALESGDSLFG